MAEAEDNERQRLTEAVDRLVPAWRELALRIHANPELGFQEHQASVWLAEAMERAGFAVERGVADMPTAFAASFETSGDTPVIAFMAEYDAKPGTGHSCGHNLSGPASCLAAHALATVAADKGLHLRVLGTPGEETGHGGKLKMISHGLFEDVDFAMMAHAGHMNLPSRDMLCRRNITAEFRNEQTDKPTGGRTNTYALDAMLLTFHGLGQMRRDLRPRTHLDGVITEGGHINRSRIYCRTARAEFLIRATSTNHVEELENRLAGIARSAAEVTHTKLEWSGQWGPYMPMKRSAALESIYAGSLDFIGEKVGCFPPEYSIGYTDFGNVSQVVPGIHAYFKAAEPGIEHHTAAYTEASRSELGLSGMVVAAKAMALTAFELVSNATLRESVRNDFDGS